MFKISVFTYDAEEFKRVFETKFTWLEGFMRNVRRFPEKLAITDPEGCRSLTYKELDMESNRLANFMIRNGVKEKDVVMYALRNSPEFILCYIAAHKAGAVAAPVNYRQSVTELADIIGKSCPKAFFYEKMFEKHIENAFRICGYRPDLVSETDENFMGLTMSEPGTEPETGFLPHIYDETTRLYTSGTTGEPRAVPVNNVNEVLSAHDVMIHFPLSRDDRTLNMTPWFHRGGLHSGGPCPTLYAGGEVIILRDFAPKRCLDYAEKYKVSFLIGVPSVISMLSRVQESQKRDLSNLKGIVAMGAPLDKAACEKYMRVLTPNIFNGYGTTESFWNTFLRPCDLPGKAGSAGVSCTDDEVRLVAIHSDGTKAEPDELIPKDGKTHGEIIISSPAKSAFSYVSDEESTKHKYYKGYLYTGDAGTWDESSYITVEGRIDDMIVSAGENIYPAQIEGILNTHPKVEESAVIGVPDGLRGKRLKAFVVASDDTLTAKELSDFLAYSKQLSYYKRPKEFSIVQGLPHTATGKIRHYKLR